MRSSVPFVSFYRLKAPNYETILLKRVSLCLPLLGFVTDTLYQIGHLKVATVFHDSLLLGLLQ